VYGHSVQTPVHLLTQIHEPLQETLRMDGSTQPSRPARRWHAAILAIISILTIAGTLAAPVSAQSGSLRWTSLDQTLGGLAPRSNLLVAEFRGSTCATIHDRDADDPLAIASVFKLYVFGELARQVQLGEAGWDDKISLTDTLRSMPSGDYAYAAAGTVVTVRNLAEAMIWASDNTATDHLISYLGRDNVQRSFAAFGHSDPAVNAPLLLTRELFGIKMTQSPAWMQQYMAASDEEQIEMLRSQIDPISINPTGGWGFWNGPTAIEGIEWFASANDLCRATASLWSMGAQPGLEPVREILTGNRGGIWDTTAFPRAGYKGGYEAGVVNMTYVMERSDGRVFFVSAGYNQPQGVVDQGTARAQLDLVFACLAITDGEASCTGSV